MKNKRWTLKIKFKGSYNWDIEEDYKQLTTCGKEAKELKDSTVELMIIEDNVTNKIYIID